MSEEFLFSILRVVPDPIKDEAVNIGVVVLRADGGGGDIMFSGRFKTRVAALRQDFPVESTLAAIEDLRAFLGLETQARFGADIGGGDPRERLNAAVQYLEGQLQLTAPRRYQAKNLGSAGQQIYKRYVAKKLPRPQPTRQPTAAEMRHRIWQTITLWSERNLVVERRAMIQGREARHPADFVLKNGVPQAAIFALPATVDDRAISFLYRDSLPTIARDVQAEHPGFQVVGVLPDDDENAPEGVRAFIDETRALLHNYPQIRTVSLSELSEIRDQLTERLI